MILYYSPCVTASDFDRMTIEHDVTNSQDIVDDVDFTYLCFDPAIDDNFPNNFLPP